MAVQAAISAYAQTGRMRDAAMAYAAHGLSVFPVDPITKKPIPKRDPDPTGEYPGGIPGTGGVYKATCNPETIEGWWRKHPNALIGLPMGLRTGIWALDVDTSEDHADGVAAFKEIVEQHGAITTREHRSATGGPHLIFNWNKNHPLGCGTGTLPGGIDVKGQGGYIVVPPSRRKDRDYTVHLDIDPVEAPAWLLDLISPKTSHGGRPTDRTIPAPLVPGLLAELAGWIPNDDVSQHEYNSMGLRFWAASNGSEEAFRAWDAWARKSQKYHGGTAERWKHYFGSPPNRTGINKLKAIAREHGWAPNLRPAEPTYPLDELHPVDEARNLTRFHIEKLFEYVFDESGGDLVVRTIRRISTRALRVPTGVGKTQIVIELLAKWIAGGKVNGPIIFAVPRHKLGEEIEKLFADHGIDARVFRGRTAVDPERDGKTMCENLEAVKLAIQCRVEVASHCCKFKKMKCRFFDRCGYQRQQSGDQPQVWIIASDMLFHSHKVFGDPAAVIIDEAIWAKGLRGIEHKSGGMEWVVPVDSLLDHGPPEFRSRCDWMRHRLGEAFNQQPANGGVERRYLDAGFNVEDCNEAIGLEWQGMPQVSLHPGMSDDDVKKLARDRDRIDAIQHARRVIKIWETVRELLEAEITVSGRLTLRQRNGQRCIEWRGVDEINGKFRVPTLLLDATLPDESILRVYHPMAEIVADIAVAMPPCVHIRQILQAPTSSNKLKNEKHLKAVRRYVLQRWIETGRQRTLVICQKEVDKWLACSCLPENITVAHYNDIAGLDSFRDVRLLILVGRTAPGPQAAEALAAALSGAMPIPATATNGFQWFDRVEHGIRMANGTGRATTGDQHPDPMAEAIRWQVHEGELMQAMGRARAVNRTADTPLDIDLLLDTCLPIIVNEVKAWAAPSLLIETAAQGVMLTAPVDLMRLWPELWPNRKAAMGAGVPTLPGFEPFEYQLAGSGMKRRLGYFDSRLVPDPAVWLRRHMGPL